MTTFISGTMADIIGLAGSVLFIIAFGYANLTKQMDQILFNSLNLLGAVLLLTSLWVHFNLAAFCLEVAWAIIAALGLGKALVERRRDGKGAA